MNFPSEILVAEEATKRVDKFDGGSETPHYYLPVLPVMCVICCLCVLCVVHKHYGCILF